MEEICSMASSDVGAVMQVEVRLARGCGRGAQSFDSFSVDCHCGHNIHAEEFGELVRIHFYAAVLGLILHVQRDNKGDIHFRQLNGNQQGTAEVFRIRDLDNCVGVFFQEDVSCNLLVLGVWG
jgi:hypothetical protein